MKYKKLSKQRYNQLTMDLSNLTPAKGSVKNRKRIARGEGSKKGGTSTRGHKGAKSRSGYIEKLDLKAGKCHFKDVCPSLVLQIQTEKNLEALIYIRFRRLLTTKKLKVKLI